jgi:hypothetical protein
MAFLYWKKTPKNLKKIKCELCDLYMMIIHPPLKLAWKCKGSHPTSETYKILHNLAPVCLQNLLHTKNSKYYFRYRNILDVQGQKLKLLNIKVWKMVSLLSFVRYEPSLLRTFNCWDAFLHKLLICWLNFNIK